MENLAIIPARGGSKSIPRKNIKLLAGKPLIAYTIEAAKAAKSVNRIVVSTDDEEIATISRKYGAEVVMRPEEISGDEAASEDALFNVLETLKNTEKYIPDCITFIQCTSPLTTSEDIDGTVELLRYKKVDSAFAVTPFRHFLWKEDSIGDVVEIEHYRGYRRMRQDMGNTLYLETGAVYAIKTKAFFDDETRFAGELAMYEMPAERCFEIDEPLDFEIAEILIRKQKVKQICDMLPDKIEAVVFDFDGVFTDNRVLVEQGGQELVICSRSDGAGISMLRELGIPMFVISSEVNPIVAKRCQKLKIDCVHGSRSKIMNLKDWCDINSIDIANVIYIGNDINDKECLEAVGCSVVVNDAHPSVRNIAKIILSSNGGKDAIRELCDIIVKKVENNGKRN